MRRARITLVATFILLTCIIGCYFSSLNAMGGQGVSEVTNTALFKGLTKDLQRTVARNATQQHMQNVASILQEHLQDTSSAISTLWHIQTHKNKWFEGLKLEDEGLANECAFANGTERYFPEMKLLVDEFAKDKSDVVVLVIGPYRVYEQIAPEFIFDTLAKTIPRKSVSIFLIDPAYSQYPPQEGMVFAKSGYRQILLSEDFISALAEQIKLPFDLTKKKTTENQVTFDDRIVVSNNNTINFTPETGFSNITLKFFATMIPIYYYHSFFSYLRAFFAQEGENKKIVFIGYVVDKNCYDTPLGLAHAYLDYKKLYPDNFFLYSSNAVYDSLERFKFNLFKRTELLGITRDKHIHPSEAPIARRFFMMTFFCVTYAKEKKEINIKDSPFITLLNHKSSFFFYKRPNFPSFTFEETPGDKLYISYDGDIAQKGASNADWSDYIDVRNQRITAFHQDLIDLYGKDHDGKQAEIMAQNDFALLGNAVQPAAEPMEFKDALISPINYEDVLE